mmetsp:Transcript_33435/g.53558  ORF Transcript_33435/g.53558 Transcript_33435/m.53558 type:complete len:224 (-) Transcript_33435:2557-3228(-)
MQSRQYPLAQQGGPGASGGGPTGPTSTATYCQWGEPSADTEPKWPGRKDSGSGSKTRISRASSTRSGHQVAESQRGAMTVAEAPSRRSFCSTRGSRSQGGLIQGRASAAHEMANASRATASGLGHRVQKRGTCRLVSVAKRSMECEPHRWERAWKHDGCSFQSLLSMYRLGASAGFSLERTGLMNTRRPSSAHLIHACRTIGMSTADREEPRRNAHSTLDASM